MCFRAFCGGLEGWAKPWEVWGGLGEAGRGWATMIEVVCNDRLGKKVRVKCNMDDTIGDLKKLIAAQTGTRAE